MREPVESMGKTLGYSLRAEVRKAPFHLAQSQLGMFISANGSDNILSIVRGLTNKYQRTSEFINIE